MHRPTHLTLSLPATAHTLQRTWLVFRCVGLCMQRTSLVFRCSPSPPLALTTIETHIGSTSAIQTTAADGGCIADHSC